MSLVRARNLWLAAALVTSPWVCQPLLAQDQTNLPAALSTNSSLARLPKFTLKSPVAAFRELLAMSFMEQMRYLTNRSPQDRKLIFAKVREYKSLKPSERELRLRVTELHWYLLPLLRMPATNRPARLGMIPEEHREPVEIRLKEWDKLPPELQKELLENEAAISCLTEPATGGRPLPAMSPERREMLDRGIRQWQELSEGQREKIMNRFNQFFTLTEEEKEKALKTLSDPERRQIDKTLRKYSELSPVQRAVCIRSFEKFANLSLEERQEFLKNADRWKVMTPDERQGWKDLVSKVSVTPTTSMLKFRLPPTSPLRTTPIAATNGN
jgi:hypothetical protein